MENTENQLRQRDESSFFWVWKNYLTQVVDFNKQSHLTVLLDLDPSLGRERLDVSRTRYDRLEAEAAVFHERVRDAYLALARDEPDRFLVLDATEPVATLQERIRTRVSALLDTLTA